MNKYIVGIDGMGCGSCEMHVEETLRKTIHAKRIKASHIKNHVIVITEENFAQEDFKRILDPTGYRVTSFERAVAVKHFFGWR